jgi:osmotically-inducible protein OsmY
MQPHLAPAARIITVAALIGGWFLLAPFGQRPAAADPVDDLLSEAAVKAALSLDPYFSSLPVTVSIQEGTATVSGKLGHPAQKRLVMRRISSVVGTSAIVDAVSVASVDASEEVEPSDPESVAKDVERILSIGKRPGKRPEVAGPGVAEELRKRAGRLKKQSEALAGRSWKVRVHDALIAARARRVLDRNILDCSIEVAVYDGVVTLSGEVPDEDSLSLAEDLVAGLSGVASVENELLVGQ